MNTENQYKMDPTMAIAGGANIIDSIIQAQTAKRNTDATIRANRQMAQYAYSKDVEQWNRANAYNSPEAQMLRLKQAGLNPHMAGQGAGGTTAVSMPKYQAPTAEYNYKPPIGLAPAVEAFQNMAVRKAQVDNVQAQTKQAEARTHNEVIRSGLLFLEGQRKLLGMEDTRSRIKGRDIVTKYNEQSLNSRLERSQFEATKAFNDLGLQYMRKQLMDNQMSYIRTLQETQRLEQGLIPFRKSSMEAGTQLQQARKRLADLEAEMNPYKKSKLRAEEAQAWYIQSIYDRGYWPGDPWWARPIRRAGHTLDKYGINFGRYPR